MDRYPYNYLRSLTKAQLIDILIPLIDKAVEINESWCDEKDGHKVDHMKFIDLEIAICCALRDMQDEFRD